MTWESLQLLLSLPVGAGNLCGEVLVWQLRSDTAEGMHLVGHFSVDSKVNRCASDTQQAGVCIPDCSVAPIAAWQLLLADRLHAGQ